MVIQTVQSNCTRTEHNDRDCRHFWHATQDCVAPSTTSFTEASFEPHPLHQTVWLRALRSCCMMLSHVMSGHPHGLLQSSGGTVDRILLASALSLIHAVTIAVYPKRVKWVWLVLLASRPRRFEQIGAQRNRWSVNKPFTTNRSLVEFYHLS